MTPELRSMSQFSPVAELNSLAPDQSTVVQFNDRMVALFNQDGTIHAVDNECPHKGAPLGGGSIEDGKIYCPFHGWDFDVNTGSCGANPDRPVTIYPVKIMDGKIHLAEPHS